MHSPKNLIICFFENKTVLMCNYKYGTGRLCNFNYVPGQRQLSHFVLTASDVVNYLFN